METGDSDVIRTSPIKSCSPPRVVSWNVMSKKDLSNEHQRMKKKKKKEQHRKTGFEPPIDQSETVKLSTAPGGIRRLLTVEELIYFVTWFFLEFVLARGALGAHLAPGITVLFHRKM